MPPLPGLQGHRAVLKPSVLTLATLSAVDPWDTATADKALDAGGHASIHGPVPNGRAGRGRGIE